MFGVSTSYFTVAIFGENIENREPSMDTTEQQQALPQEVETHNESGEPSPEHLNKTQNMETAESKEGMEGTGVHQETASENQRRALELSLSVTAGIGYAVIALWMILDNRNSRFPFIVAIAGSIVLLVIYSASRISWNLFSRYRTSRNIRCHSGNASSNNNYMFIICTSC